MKKIRLLFLVLTLLAVNIAFAADEIHFTVTGQNSVTFDWRGTATEKTIGYGLASGVYTQVTATAPNPLPVSSSGPFWEATLTGLTENTRYYYSIGNGPERSFRTPPAPGGSDFNVYAQGNIGNSTTYFNTGAVQDIIANDLPAFVVGLGDLTLGSKNGKATIDQHFNDVMVWSKEVAYMPVWGDMDTISSSIESFKNYKGRFAVPNPQTSPGSPLAGGEDWYWFDYGNVRFITMPESWTGAWTDWNTKAGTLMAQAEADSNIKFIVTFVHRPAYSSGRYTGSSTLKGKLDALGDTYSKYKLNINAHSNNYERSLPQHGVIHVTAGTGGANLTQDGTNASCPGWLTCPKPAWSAFRAMHLGALKLHFTASGIEGSFICGPTGGGTNDVTCIKGSVVDSFTIASSSTAVPSVSKVATTTTSSMTASAAAVSSTTITCTQYALNVSGATLDSGYSYYLGKIFGIPADTSAYPTRSTLRLFENNLEIGPPHSLHADISSKGLGRFSHKIDSDGSEGIRFSASNNTNPITNGKSYSYCLTSTTTSSDTQAPTVPSGLTATASSSSQINLSWSASTDNVAVTGYNIYRNGSQIGTTAATSYSDSGLTASTSYGYTVAAYDAVNNTSGKSTAATAMTATSTTTPPPTTTSSCAPAPTSSTVVNVKDKSATGNGSTNDTAAIQAAINQVAGSGGTVLVPDGTYMIDAITRLFLKSNMTLRMTSGAVLKAIPNNQANYGVLRIENVSNVNVIGGKVQGERAQHQGTSGEWGHGIEVLASNKVVIEGVTSSDMWGDGFYIGSNSSNVTACSIVADNNRRQGLSMTSVNGAVIQNSIFMNTNGTYPMSGLDIEPNAGETVNNVQVLKSKFQNNTGTGLLVGFPSATAATTASITNLLIDGNTINNNGVIGTYSAGIKLSRLKSITNVTNNIVKDNTQDGIIIVNSSTKNIVTGNTVTGSGYNNNVDKYIGNGVLIESGAAGNTVINNTVTGNKAGILDLVGGNTISPNTVK